MDENWGKSLVNLAAVGCVLALVTACQPRANNDDPVFGVVRSNDATRLRQYLAEGGDPDSVNGEGDSLLFVAAGARGGLAVLERLLLAGADTEIASAEGRTPLHVAAGWCNVTIVAALIGAGARIEAIDSNGKSVQDSVYIRPADRRGQVNSLLTAGLNGAGGD